MRAPSGENASEVRYSLPVSKLRSCSPDCRLQTATVWSSTIEAKRPSDGAKAARPFVLRAANRMDQLRRPHVPDLGRAEHGRGDPPAVGREDDRPDRFRRTFER